MRDKPRLGDLVAQQPLGEAAELWRGRIPRGFPSVIAQAAYPMIESNPWRFEDGRFYTVTDLNKGRRTFVADVRNGRVLISFIRDEAIDGPFEPSVVLSAEDWKSLAPTQ